ncbi:MAG: LysR family transcriptional regulator [Bacteroidetes bacterium]|nr:LysR family transcriptional regulator [Bacteroidota bacterium]
MNLQQLEYIIAVDQHRHFATAADRSFVTQPTLSMMVKKLEDELGVLIFDRSRHPVEPTREGIEILKRARAIVGQVNSLKEYVNETKHEIRGELRVGIIPTLAPYLLPLFLEGFHRKYSQLKLQVREMVTDELLAKLECSELDVAIMATPAGRSHFREHHLFYEEFVAYASRTEKLPKKKYILPREIDIQHLWLLQEGHCLRNQVYNLCELKKRETSLSYEAGSIETLINLVDKAGGITIIPKLAEYHMRPQQREHIREFATPKPVREISLVVTTYFPREKLLSCLKEEIMAAIPHGMKEPEQVQVAPIR